MVSENLKDFVEQRLELTTIEDFKALEDFLEQEGYLKEGARKKLLIEFADKIGPELPPDVVQYEWGKMKVVRNSKGQFAKGGHKV